MTRHPALERLDRLVGRWAAQVKVEGVGEVRSEFAWQDGGLFLRQFTDVGPISSDTPQGVAGGGGNSPPTAASGFWTSS